MVRPAVPHKGNINARQKASFRVFLFECKKAPFIFSPGAAYIFPPWPKRQEQGEKYAGVGENANEGTMKISMPLALVRFFP